MTEYICACDAICAERQRGQVAVSLQNPAAIWSNLWRLIEIIGSEAIEIYRWNNDVQPKFSNGGTRFLIRPDRIDLV
ncbi:MAG: hypothetical protein N2117_14560 [Anaerolineales bacterium]|nr:hypothetical protein [Anaerolineales bacterium]